MPSAVRYYAGEGVSERAKAALSGDPIFASEIADGSWVDSTSVFIMPGGRSRFFSKHLEGEANTQIERFVERGGRYVGICGGAYYASRRIAFGVGTPLEIICERPLDFYPGTAEGPIYNEDTFAYEGASGVSESGACLVPIFLEEEPLLAYYNGGCTFSGAPAEILATYPDKRPAIICVSVGQGDAVLSGVHPEFSPQPFLEQFLT